MKSKSARNTKGKAKMNRAENVKRLAASLYGGERGKVLIDSREAASGDVFVALPGSRTHGNAFIKEAFRKGAALAVAERGEPHPKDPRVLTADDTGRFLRDLAAEMRAISNARFIGVTGSNGKTTTKDMTALCLGYPRLAYKTQGNHNNHLGVPLTICNHRSRHRHVVCELGSSGPGEIARLASLVQPHASVITNIGQAHLSGLSTREGIAEEKSAIFARTAPDGVCFLTRETQRFAAVEKAIGRRRAVFFGLSDEEFSPAEVRIGEKGMSWAFGGERFTLESPARHNLLNAQAALAVAAAEGISLEVLAARLAKWSPFEHRMCIFSWKKRRILDDCYNANPASLASAVETAVSLRRGRTQRVFAALGDMKELGRQSARLHAWAGRLLADAGVDVLLAIGSEMRTALRHFERSGGSHSLFCEGPADMARFLRASTRPSDIILVKGSRGMRMEEVLNLLTA